MPTFWEGGKDNAVLMNNLQLLQNKAAKTILDRPFHSSATYALEALGLLALEKRRLFHCYLYVYKCVNEISAHSINLLANKDLHGYDTTQSLSSVIFIIISLKTPRSRTIIHRFLAGSLISDIKSFISNIKINNNNNNNKQAIEQRNNNNNIILKSTDIEATRHSEIVCHIMLYQA